MVQVGCVSDLQQSRAALAVLFKMASHTIGLSSPLG
jgi:hypothetical protein